MISNVIKRAIHFICQCAQENVGLNRETVERYTLFAKDLFDLLAIA